jgi:predicted dithiol-disulfide oxidoreductase (DUF899 family)
MSSRTVSRLRHDPAQEAAWLRAKNAHLNQEVVRLSAESADLRRALESRAVIEQAKKAHGGRGLPHLADLLDTGHGGGGMSGGVSLHRAGPERADTV